ncbi:MAG: hypothetical protein M1481_00440 [Candidatus Thermoplasmatota archaeon]|nr:hypothetical protein [Candidatus Thermoplasmatota archaeon]MCL5963745.1 hypothetical protein [Candidatus Thermoplasmatota archaeon]
MLSSASLYIKENKENLAKKVIKQAQILINESLKSGVEEEIEYIKQNLTQLRAEGMDITKVREYLKETRIAAENGDYITGIKIAKTSHKVIDNMKGNKSVTETVSKKVLENKVNKEVSIPAETVPKEIKKDLTYEPISTTLPEEFSEYIRLTNVIKTAIQNDYDLNDTLNNLQKILQYHREEHVKIKQDIEESLWKKYTSLKDLYDFYINNKIIIKDIDNIMEKCKSDIEQSFYEISISDLNELEQKLKDPLQIYPIVKKESEIATALLILTESQTNQFKEANALMDKGELKESFELLYTLHKEFFVGIKDNLSNKKNEIWDIINIIKSGNISYDEYIKQQETFEKSLEKGLLIDSYDAYMKIKNSSEKAFFQIIVQKSGDLRIKTLAAKNMGVNITINLNSFLENIKKLTNEKKLIDALTLLNVEENKMNKNMHTYKEISGYVSNIENRIKKMKESGMDIKDLDDKLINLYNILNKDYDVSMNKAKEILDEINKYIANYKKSVEMNIVMTDKIEINKTTWGEYILKNTGDVNIVDISVKTENTVLEEIPKINMLRRGDTKKLRFNMVFNKEMETLGIKIEGKDAYGGSAVITEYKKSFEVSHPQIATGIKKEPETVKPPLPPAAETTKKEEEPAKAKLMKASGNEICFVCKGHIKKDLPILKCSCNAVYHQPCGNRVRVCVQCKKPLI